MPMMRENFDPKRPVSSIRVWETGSGKLQAKLTGAVFVTPRPNFSPIGGLRFSPDSRLLAAGAGDGSLWLWECEAGKQAFQARLPLGRSARRVGAHAVSGDGRLLATADAYDGRPSGAARLWDLGSGRLRAVLPGGGGGVTRLAFSPDSTRLAAARLGGTDLWSTSSGRLQAALTGHTGEVSALAFAPDGRKLASGGADRSIRLWDLPAGRLRAVLSEHRLPIETLVFSPDSASLASSGPFDIRVRAGDPPRLWDVRTGRLLASLPADVEPGIDMAFATDGGPVALTRMASVEIRDSRSGALIRTLEMPPDPPNPVVPQQVRFSADGRSLVARTPRQIAVWNVASGALLLTEGQRAPSHSDQGLTGMPMDIGFSRDGRSVAALDSNGRVHVWDLQNGRKRVVTRLADCPPEMARGLSVEGAAVTLLDPAAGTGRITLLPIPAALTAPRGGKPIEVDARPIEVDARPSGGRPWDEWFVATPEGYFDCSVHAARYVMWNVDGSLFPAERYMKRFRRPDLVRKALRGEKITAPGMSLSDVPPTARFVGLRDGQSVGGARLTITVEATGNRSIARVELLLNGRPLSPLEARPARVVKPAPGYPDPLRPSVTRFTYAVTLPKGRGEVRIRAIASDQQELSSEPAQVTLRRSGPLAAAGRLFVLAVGVSRYRQGSGIGVASSVGMTGRVGNLRFAAGDAKAVAARFRGAKTPLYAGVEVRSLTDAQATLANIRAGLKWLEQSVRPGKSDTVVVYLSGHGYSTDTGSYGFAPHDFDPKKPKTSSLTSAELKEALGGRLRAGKVFLFVDTCHAGALSCRNDDLAIEVGAGVYLLASAGVGDNAYESPEWKHGAFTLALLKSMTAASDRLEKDGRISFAELATGVQRELGALLKAVGRNEGEQTPCVFFSGLDSSALVTSAGGVLR